MLSSVTLLIDGGEYKADLYSDLAVRRNRMPLNIQNEKGETQ